jgi:hypothetical protein
MVRRVHGGFTASSFGSNVDWTPDGKNLVFTAGEPHNGPDSISLISLNTKEIRRLTTAPSGIGDNCFVVSPDGKMLAFVRSGIPFIGDIYLLSMSGGEPRRRSASKVTAGLCEPSECHLGGWDLPVEYAGRQGEFPGLDQVNLRLPRSLATGQPVEYTLGLSVEGQPNRLYTPEMRLRINDQRLRRPGRSNVGIKHHDEADQRSQQDTVPHREPEQQRLVLALH